MKVPPSSRRVREHSPSEANRRIDEQTQARLVYFSHQLDLVQGRLEELDREWDIERVLEANAASVTLLSLLGGLMGRRRSLLPWVVAGFLLQHAIQGWCPPVELFRRLGFRTMREIDQERFALKALRGDFENLRPDGKAPLEAARAADQAVRE